MTKTVAVVIALIVGAAAGAGGVWYFHDVPSAEQVEANVKERLLSDAQKAYMASLKDVFDQCVEDTKKGTPSFASFGEDAVYQLDCTVATSTATKG